MSSRTETVPTKNERHTPNVRHVVYGQSETYCGLHWSMDDQVQWRKPSLQTCVVCLEKLEQRGPWWA